MTAPKVLQDNSSGRGFTRITAVETNPGNANQIIATTTGGYIDSSFFAESGQVTLVASEAIAAGNQVNINSSDGTVRKANAASGLAAVGFAPSVILQAASGVIYLQDGAVNNQLLALTPGLDYFLSDSSPGAITSVIPTTVGHLKQYVGTALSTTTLKQSWDGPLVL